MSNKSSIRGSVYEEVVSTLIDGLRAGANLSDFEQKYGATNRINGASGYRHQIDVSLLGPSDLYLFEAKCLQRVLGVQEVLVIGSRLADISAAFPKHRVHASVVSMKHVSKNAETLAKHFKVNIDWIQDIRNFGVTFAKQHFVGYAEKIGIGCRMEIEAIHRDRKSPQ